MTSKFQLVCRNVFVLALTVLAGLTFQVHAQTQFGPGAQTANFTSAMVRGYHFTSPTNFNICQLYVDNAMNNNMWHVEVVKFNSAAPPAFPGTTNAFTSLFYADSVTGNNPINCNIPIASGDIIGIYGSRSGTGNIMANSYNGTQPVTTILGNNVTLYRSGMQFPLNNQQMHDIWSEINFNTARIYGFYGCCPNPPAPQGPISGDTTLCVGDTVTYTIPWDSFAVSYEWSVPAGDSIIAGQGDSTITVVIGPNSLGGQICVAMVDTCATGPDTCINYTINQPASPPSLSGSNQVCQNSSGWYSTPVFAGGSGYNWSIPPGSSILSNPDSNVIEIQFGSASGEVCISVTDSCATSDSICQFVTVSPLPSLANAGTDKAICTGLQASLTASPPSIGTGSWSIQSAPGPGQFSDPSDPTSSYTTNAFGQHVLVWTVSSPGCPSSSDAMVVNVGITPTANFSTQNVCEGAPVAFQDQSTGNGATINSWLWDMDGDLVDNHINQNPIHNYQNSGTYNVRLIVNAQGCADTLFKNVFVNPRPDLDIAADNKCFEQGVEIENGSTIPTGIIDSVFWNFGDGSGLQPSGMPFLDLEPIHFYDQPGTYTITHSAISDSGCVQSGSIVVEVYHLPVASFNALNSCQYLTTEFNDLSTVTAANIETWAWSFGDGTDSSYLQNPSHDYLVNGFVPVVLNVWSDEGCFDDTLVNVEIFPTPKSEFNYTNRVCLGEVLELEEQTALAYGSVVAFEWLIDDTIVYTGNTASHLFNEIGWYTVSLTSESDQGCRNTIIKDVPVYDIPVANFTFESQCKDVGVAFRDSSSVRDGALTTFEWDFGDGSEIETYQYPVYAFDTHGIFNVTLTVGSFKGCKASVTYPVKIYEAVSPKFVVLPDSGCSPMFVEFADSTQQFTNSDLSYVWHYGDGFSRKDTAYYTYVNTTGKLKVYDVTLEVFSDEGCVSSYTMDSAVYVHPQPLANFESSPDLGAITTSNPLVQFKNTSQQANWYVWTFGDGTRTNEHNPTHVFKEFGEYEVMLAARNIYNCVDTLRKIAVVEHANIPFIPTAFSPNGDGLNETFFIQGLQDVLDFEMYIYDRWGGLIYSGQGIDAGWNGRDPQNRIVQQGVYVYKIKYSDSRGANFELTGNIAVLGIEN